VNSFVIAGITFLCTFGGALFGMFLRAALPNPHLSSDSKDVIKMGTGLIATMSALVLGLLIASAKSALDAQRTGFQQMATNIVLLDRTLTHYGPDAKAPRELLRGIVASAIARLWPADGSPKSGLEASEFTANGNALYEAIRDLTPKTDAQRASQSQALQISADVGRTRLLLSQRDEGSIPKPFLGILMFWLSVLFISFGLFSPGNGTVIVVLIVCALSVASALLLIVDMSEPFTGLFQISSSSLRNALGQLGQ
jgi:hypothetical protein